ncbi:MAG: type II toxin-antitoxin system RelE/ParE family toxin [Candidatus Daviesbacteria bacterium]|nr:type II toxin-antitoxin system RelE/ParE family toxin [Candidatus Daviesbacteria bacterium]
MENKWKIIYYISTTGTNPVSDFLDTLESNSQTKILRILHNIQEYGLDSVIPHIKKLSGTPFWEIRILGQDSIRVIYVVSAKFELLVLHGFKKKTQKTPSKELGTASSRYKEYTLRAKL